MKLQSLLFLVLFASAGLFFIGCAGGIKDDNKPIDFEELTKNQPEVRGTMVKESEITFSNPLNAEWVATGKAIYELKCLACHTLTDKRIVGPGFANVTKTREPAWLMNMILNIEIMLEKDPEAQKLLELCLIRMPDQNVSFDEARAIIEFMRSNDGGK